jgi:hypothetical protein
MVFEIIRAVMLFFRFASQPLLMRSVRYYRFYIPLYRHP